MCSSLYQMPPPEPCISRISVMHSTNCSPLDSWGPQCPLCPPRGEHLELIVDSEELQTKVPEYFTITKKAPTRGLGPSLATHKGDKGQGG